MTTQPTDERVEKVAEQLHEWYLEATNEDGAKYNHEAVVPYGDLPEGSKLLDRYIASKIITTLLTDCEARVRGNTLNTLQAYNELLLSVQNKFENESRHQTILRYIKQSEEVSPNPTQLI